MKKKLIILGIDGTGLEMVNKQIDCMPTMKKLMGKSAWGVLKGTDISITAPLWISFQTGKDVFNHGITNFMLFDENLNEKFVDSNAIKDPTYYEILDNCGKKQFMMNMIFSKPAKIAGDMVCSWLTFDDETTELIHPKNLSEKFPKLKNYKVFPDNALTIKKRLKNHLEQLKTNNECFKEVYDKGDYDVYFYLMSNTDWIQHLAYEEIINDKKTGIVKNAKKILKEVDSTVKYVLDNMDDDTELVVVSDHGFKMYDGKFLINTWLYKNGYFKLSKEGKDVKEWKSNKKSMKINIRWLTKMVKSNPFLLKLSEPVYRLLSDLNFIDFEKREKIEWGESIAYCPSFVDGIVYINHNIKDKDKVVNDIISGLKKDFGDDIKAVDIREKINRNNAGDIWVSSEKYEFDSSIAKNSIIPGKRSFHDHEGFVFFYGKNVKPQKLPTKDIYDMMPTLLSMMDCPFPNDIDGKVIQEPFIKPLKEKKEKINFNNKKEMKNIIDDIKF